MMRIAHGTRSKVQGSRFKVQGIRVKGQSIAEFGLRIAEFLILRRKNKVKGPRLRISELKIQKEKKLGARVDWYNKARSTAGAQSAIPRGEYYTVDEFKAEIEVIFLLSLYMVGLKKVSVDANQVQSSTS